VDRWRWVFDHCVGYRRNSTCGYSTVDFKSISSGCAYIYTYTLIATSAIAASSATPKLVVIFWQPTTQTNPKQHHRNRLPPPHTHHNSIGAPNLVVCLDSGCGNYDQLWVTDSLRGVVVGELTVSVLSEGVHSGDASGVVPDTFRVARKLLSRLEDETTGKILPPGLSVEITPKRLEMVRTVLNSVWTYYIYYVIMWVADIYNVVVLWVCCVVHISALSKSRMYFTANFVLPDTDASKQTLQGSHALSRAIQYS
jgi:hypothetical protein